MQYDDSHLAPVDVTDRLRFERGLARMLDEYGPARPVVATVGDTPITECEVMAARDAESIRRLVALENEFEHGLGPALECLALILIHDHVDGRPLRTEEYRALFDDYVDAIHRADAWQFDELRAADLRNSIDETVADVAAFARATDPDAVDSRVVADDDDDDEDEDDDWYEVAGTDDEDDELDDDDDEEGDYDVDLDDLRAALGTAPPSPAPAVPPEPRVWFPRRRVSGG